jgi:hypothetical protein
MIANTSARVTNETCGPPYSRGWQCCPAAAGELFDFRPRQLALLVALGGLQAGDLRQLMGGLRLLRRCSTCAGNNRGRRPDHSGQLHRQTRHQRRSLAARNALAICTGVIVTIPTSHS